MTASDTPRARSRWAEARSVGLVLLVDLVVIAVVLAFGNAAEAGRQRDVDTARLLAARSGESFTLDPQRAVLLALAGDEVADTGEGRAALIRAVEHQQQVLRYLDVPADGGVRGAAFTPSGDLLATAGADGVVRLWGMPGSVPVGELVGSAGGEIVFSPDGGTLYAAGTAGITVWDVASRGRRTDLASGSTPLSLAISPDGALLAQGGPGGEVVLWDTGGGRQVLLPGVGGPVSAVAFSPDGRTLLAGAADGSVAVWDTTTALPVGAWDGFAPGTEALAFSPDGTAVAFNGFEWGTVEVRQVADGALLATVPGYGSVVHRLQFLDQQVLVAATADGSLVAVDLVTGDQQDVVGPLADVTDVAIHQDGHTVASVAPDGTVAVWDTSRMSAAPTGSLLGQLTTMALHPGGDLVATGDTAGAGVLRDLRPAGPGVPEPDRGLSGEGQVNGVGFDNDGSLLAVAHDTGATVLWRLGGGEPQQQAVLQSDASAVASVFSPDGSVLAVGLVDGRVELWDVASATRAGILQSRTLPDGMAIAFSPDGRTLASATVDGIGLWDVATRTRTRTLAGPIRVGTTGLAFSPDGTRLAESGLDGRVVLWTVSSTAGADGDRFEVVPGHHARVTGLAFSPDGRTLASGDAAGVIVLSDTGTLVAQAVLAGPLVTGLGFGPDGASLISTSYDGDVLRWDLHTAVLRERLCGILGRDLDPVEWAAHLPDRPQTPVCPR